MTVTNRSNNLMKLKDLINQTLIDLILVKPAICAIVYTVASVSTNDFDAIIFCILIVHFVICKTSSLTLIFKVIINYLYDYWLIQQTVVC